MGGTDLAGVLSDKELQGRGRGWGGGGGGGEVKRLSAALSRSAFEPVKESPLPSPKRFIIFYISVHLLFFKIAFPVLNFLHLVICKRCTDITGRFKCDTGVCLYSFDGSTF